MKLVTLTSATTHKPIAVNAEQVAVLYDQMIGGVAATQIVFSGGAEALVLGSVDETAFVLSGDE